MKKGRIGKLGNCLAAAHLAVTAETGELRALDEIIDTPLSSIPELPPTLRDYERRMVDRRKVSQENQRNHLKRKRLLIEAWDEVCQTLHAWTLRFAPLLHTMMYEACDLRKQGIIGSHFDGQDEDAKLLSPLDQLRESTPCRLWQRALHLT